MNLNVYFIDYSKPMPFSERVYDSVEEYTRFVSLHAERILRFAVLGNKKIMIEMI